MRTGGREMSEARLGRERRDLILRRGENWRLVFAWTPDRDQQPRLSRSGWEALERRKVADRSLGPPTWTWPEGTLSSRV